MAKIYSLLVTWQKVPDSLLPVTSIGMCHRTSSSCITAVRHRGVRARYHHKFLISLNTRFIVIGHFDRQYTIFRIVTIYSSHEYYK